jgi:calcium-translocating P-type ATPase
VVPVPFGVGMPIQNTFSQAETDARSAQLNLFRAEAEEVLRSLGTARSSGLTHQEVERRRAEYGPNAVEKVAGRPLHQRFFSSFTHFFALILWLAAGIAFAAELVQPGQGMATLAFAILGVIVINGLFAFWQEFRADQTLAKLARLLPIQVKVIRDGHVGLITSEDLVPGDVALIEQGDRVPADCRLVEAIALRVSNATVTGEALPLRRTAERCDTSEILRAENVLLAGTSVLAGEGVAVVFATGRNTEFGKIAKLAQARILPRSPFLKEIAFVSRVIAALAVVLGIVFFFVGVQAGLGPWQASMFGIGIIVANVPEGLLPTITLALAMSAKHMARRNVLVRHLAAVETLGATTVICTDKTGTLTENRMAVKDLFLTRNLDLATSTDLKPLSNAADRRFCEVARRCHTVKPAGDSPKAWFGDPMEIALINMADSAGFVDSAGTLQDTIPFDPNRRCMSTLYDTAAGRVLYVKGAPEAVIPMSVAFEGLDGQKPLTDVARQRIEHAVDILAGGGLRILALAYRQLPQQEVTPTEESELVLLGLVSFEDPPREGVREAIAVARMAGIRVMMTTGDHPNTALAIARQIGLVDSGDSMQAITGDSLCHLSEAQLRVILDAPTAVFARLAADQKLQIVRALKAKGHVVAVTGDGVNDAPALREADIGIAMGFSGSDVAREAADMILVEDNFVNIIDGIEEGRAVFDNVRKFMTYVLTSNIPEIVPYLAFALFRIPLPLTIIQILAVDLGTDMIPALALGVEKPHPKIMHRPPRSRGQRLLNWPLLLRSYLFLGMIEALAAMSAYFFALIRSGWVFGQSLATNDPLYRQATSACLLTIVIVQMVNVFLCRDERSSVFRQNPLANLLIPVGIVVETSLILLIIYTPAGNSIFGTMPLAPSVWLFALPFAAVMLAAEEGRKWLLRRWITRFDG